MEARRAILKRDKQEDIAVDPPKASLDKKRECTRCDGFQHLLGSAFDLGKYRCDTCELVIGFDLEANPAEFIISRGVPSAYSKNIFGPRLATEEQRLP